MKPITLRNSVILAAVPLLASCTSVSDPTSFYTLHPSPETAAPRHSSAQPSIGLGPVYFPRLLDRPQIVVRKSDSEVQLAEFHQWGGALEEDFSRVLAANLATRSGRRVYVYPWESRAKPDTQIQISVDRFDGGLGDYVQFEGQWQIVRTGNTLTQRLSLREPVTAAGYAAYVEGMSRILARIAEQIAEALRTATP